jgi:23S rRNA pseudouridine2605 synthase
MKSNPNKSHARAGGLSRDKQERAGKPFNRERAERTGKPYDRERSERTEKPYKKERTERTNTPYNKERPERAGKPYNKERPERAGKPYNKERPERAGKPYSKERPERANNPYNKNRPERAGKPKWSGTPFKKEKKNNSAPLGDGMVRLNKFISNSGVCSRREADEYITAGLVSVNGETITKLGTRVNPSDDIRFNGERLRGEEKVYIVMNKPKDFVTTVSDPNAARTVMQLIEGKCSQRVYPVGRLDRMTTGVLMFTNDGDLAEKLTHPSGKRRKIYQVHLDKNLSGTDFDKILSGITLDDGPIQADALSYIDNSKDVVGIEIHSGRNRIVRRIFESMGYKIRKLDRVYFAGLTKKNLKRGQWRFLDEKEISMLKMGAHE